MRPGQVIGAVGARLLYPDDTIQHAGVVLGIGGVAGHLHCRASRRRPRVFRAPDADAGHLLRDGGVHGRSESGVCEGGRLRRRESRRRLQRCGPVHQDPGGRVPDHLDALCGAVSRRVEEPRFRSRCSEDREIPPGRQVRSAAVGRRLAGRPFLQPQPFARDCRSSAGLSSACETAMAIHGGRLDVTPIGLPRAESSGRLPRRRSEQGPEQALLNQSRRGISTHRLCSPGSCEPAHQTARLCGCLRMRSPVTPLYTSPAIAAWSARRSCGGSRAEGFTNILSATREQLDLRDQAAVNYWFQANRPEYVFLVAGTVGGILANSHAPGGVHLRQPDDPRHGRAREPTCIGVKRLLYLGSSCIYPRDCPQPISEEVPAERPARADQRAVRDRQDRRHQAVPGVSPAVRLRLHLGDADQPLRPGRQLRSRRARTCCRR